MSCITNPQKYREATCSKNEEGFLEGKSKQSRVDPQNVSFQEARHSHILGYLCSLALLGLTIHFGSRVLITRKQVTVFLRLNSITGFTYTKAALLCDHTVISGRPILFSTTAPETKAARARTQALLTLLF